MPRNADSAPAFLPRDEDRAGASPSRSSVLAPDRSRKYSLPVRSVLFLLAQGAQDIFRTPPFLKDRETGRPLRSLRPNTIGRWWSISSARARSAAESIRCRPGEKIFAT